MFVSPQVALLARCINLAHVIARHNSAVLICLLVLHAGVMLPIIVSDLFYAGSTLGAFSGDHVQSLSRDSLMH